MAVSIDAPLTLENRYKKADLIVKVSIVKVITIEDGSPEDFRVPATVAQAKVVEVYKRCKDVLDTIIYIPGGYSFDPFPPEVTKGNKYLLFLESMKVNYYRPVDRPAVYIISGQNSIDTESKENIPVKDF